MRVCNKLVSLFFSLLMMFGAAEISMGAKRIAPPPYEVSSPSVIVSVEGGTSTVSITITNKQKRKESYKGSSGPGSAFSFAGDGSFLGSGGTCGASLPGESSCTVNVKFSPPSPGLFNTSIAIIYSSFTVNFSLSGTTVKPKKIVAGNLHTCAIASDSTVKCWGYNGFGGLGDGTLTDASLPVAVSGLSNVVGLSAGGAFSCAVLSNSKVKCWGSCSRGKLGNGCSSGKFTIPEEVSGLSNVVSLASGDGHTCALLSDSSVSCWGANGNGQIGNNSSFDATTPVGIGLSGVVGLAAGQYHTCAVLSDSSVRCWGSNVNGQLGNDSGNNSINSVPLPVKNTDGTNLSSAVSLASGDGHTCAVLSNSTLSCWGLNNYGQLGLGYEGGTFFSPQALSGDFKTGVLAARYMHTCAVLPDSTMNCWGFNAYGQLGNGNYVPSPYPVPVQGLYDAVSIAAGDYHTCALLSNNAIKCWGSNANGQLGVGSLGGSSNIPVDVSF